MIQNLFIAIDHCDTQIHVGDNQKLCSSTRNDCMLRGHSSMNLYAADVYRKSQEQRELHLLRLYVEQYEDRTMSSCCHLQTFEKLVKLVGSGGYFPITQHISPLG